MSPSQILRSCVVAGCGLVFVGCNEVVENPRTGRESSGVYFAVGCDKSTKNKRLVAADKIRVNPLSESVCVDDDHRLEYVKGQVHIVPYSDGTFAIRLQCVDEDAHERFYPSVGLRNIPFVVGDRVLIVSGNSYVYTPTSEFLGKCGLIPVADAEQALDFCADIAEHWGAPAKACIEVCPQGADAPICLEHS